MNKLLSCGRFILLLTFTLSFLQNISCQYDGSEEVDNSEDTEQTTVIATTTKATTNAPQRNISTADPVHVIGQVNNIINNVETFNISGIVDQALLIRTNAPVRNLVNGIIASVFCNSWFTNLSNCGNRQTTGSGQGKINRD